MITQREIDDANLMDINSYLKAHGIATKRVGSAYEWESPTGKVSIQGNRWYSQYEQVGGYSINFIMKYFGLKFTEAVESLVDAYALSLDLTIMKGNRIIMVISSALNEDNEDKLFYQQRLYCSESYYSVILKNDNCYCKENPYYKETTKDPLNKFSFSNTSPYDAIEKKTLNIKGIINLKSATSRISVTV